MFRTTVGPTTIIVFPVIGSFLLTPAANNRLIVLARACECKLQYSFGLAHRVHIDNGLVSAIALLV